MNPSAVKGFADDYAFLISGLIDLYETTANPKWLKWSKELQEKQNSLFYDEEDGGFFSAASSTGFLIELAKESYADAMPSVNSVSISNLSRLSQFLDDKSYSSKARDTAQAFAKVMKERPTQMPMLIDSLSYVLGDHTQIIIAGASEDSEPLLKIVNGFLIPNRVLMYADSSASQKYLEKYLPFVNFAKPMDGKTTVFVCENYTCQMPVTNRLDLERQITAIIAD